MTLTPKHAAIKSYYERRQEFAAQGVTTEMTVRDAFKALLESTARDHHWTLVAEQKVEGMRLKVRPDDTLPSVGTEQLPL